MFVQVIQGQTSDVGAMRVQIEAWEQDVKPGAIGFLGSTGGVTEDGDFIIAARFDSEESARANSDRAEQSAWWEETSKLFNGDPTFYDCTDVDEFGGGGSDDAGFVQVIQGYAKDKQRLRELMGTMSDAIGEARPDVIGGLVAWGPNDGFSDFVYFTSEAEAREGEKKDADAGNNPTGEEWDDLVSDVKFLDLKDPWLTSP